MSARTTASVSFGISPRRRSSMPLLVGADRRGEPGSLSSPTPCARRAIRGARRQRRRHVLLPDNNQHTDHNQPVVSR